MRAAQPRQRGRGAVMDMSFANQALSAGASSERRLIEQRSVVPKEIDDEIAPQRLATMGVDIDALTAEQANTWTRGRAHKPRVSHCVAWHDGLQPENVFAGRLVRSSARPRRLRTRVELRCTTSAEVARRFARSPSRRAGDQDRRRLQLRARRRARGPRRRVCDARAAADGRQPALGSGIASARTSGHGDSTPTVGAAHGRYAPARSGHTCPHYNAGGLATGSTGRPWALCARRGAGPARAQLVDETAPPGRRLPPGEALGIRQ